MLQFKVHGKWILAGEHSVLRGGQALVFPVESRALEFSFTPLSHGQNLIIEDSQPELEDAFWKVFARALDKLEIKKTDCSGTFNLKSNIPVGAGMGASATLCVSLSRLFSSLGFLKKEDEFLFAKDLENIFHGESSGVDVAVSLHNKPLLFTRHKALEFFEPAWKPHFYLSYCGEKGMTSVCVEKVQNLFKTKPQKAEMIDQNMKTAVDLAIKALMNPQDTPNIILALETAAHCFFEWDIVGPELKNHMNWLKSKGAIAVKPTGSGWGGFVLSLWPESLSGDSELSKILIKA